jgi:NAD dependent epimerase/dehydratase
MNKTVLVTGADGFIGSHLVEHLLAQGHAVRALVQYNAFGSWGWLDTVAAAAAGEVEIVAGDVRDPRGMDAAVDGCDAVLHLAALISIPHSYANPDSHIETNVRGTLNVLQAARRAAVGLVVVTSTSEVYGTAQFVPITEQHPLNAQSPYAASKVAADQLALSFHRAFDLPVTILRPFNTYGPRQSIRAVIPTVATQIAAGQRRIKLGNLAPTRDFNFVGDTVRAFSLALDAPGVVGEVVNIGSNFEISIGDTARLIAEVMGAEVAFETEAARLRPAASEVERLCADNGRSRELLGWQPEYAGRDGFARGLAATVQWFSEPENLAHYKPHTYQV